MLVVIDAFSKYALAQPIKKKTEKRWRKPLVEFQKKPKAENLKS